MEQRSIRTEWDGMLYFDRQMQRIQAGFNELNQQMSEKEVQVRI